MLFKTLKGIMFLDQMLQIRGIKLKVARWREVDKWNRSHLRRSPELLVPRPQKRGIRVTSDGILRLISGKIIFVSFFASSR
jgi:hypothetical protein